MEHFAAALVWFVAASVLLPVIAPAIAGGAYGAPGVIAIVHMLTLGFVLTIITGALQQIAPIAMGVAARSHRTAHVAFGMIVTGTIFVAAGARLWTGVLLAIGWVLIVGAVALTWVNLVGRLRRATRGHDMSLAVRAGFISLFAAFTVVGARVGSVLGWWTVTPAALLTAHAHLALGGFATVIAMGVGTQMAPTFLSVRYSAPWLGHAAWRATFAGSMVVAAGSITGSAIILRLGAASLAAGVVSWIAFIAVCFWRRGTRLPDGTAVLIAVANLSLLTAAALGIAILFLDNAQLTMAYGISALFGWLTMFITGATTRIVPMLLRSRPGARAVAPSRLRLLPVAAVASAAAVLVAGAASGNLPVVRAGAWLQAAGAVLMVLTHALRNR
jgi:hypothetical protein